MSGVRIDVQVVGLDGLRNNLLRWKGRITGEVTTAINQSLRQAKTTVQAGTPVRTGMAQAGWTVDRTGPMAGRLSNPVPYVPYLVHGTRYMDPSQMLNEALDRAEQQIDADLPALGARIVGTLEK